VSESQAITWADIEPAYDELATTLGDLDTILKRDDELSQEQAYRRAFVRLVVGVETALNHLTALYNRLDDPNARPLEVVLAELVAEGHGLWGIQTYGVEPIWYCSSRRHDMASDDSSGNERGEAQRDSPVAAAEARLAQVRALHASRTIRHFVRLTVFDIPVNEGVCGTGCDSTTSTDDPALVTCPACRVWLDEKNVPPGDPLARAERERDADASEAGASEEEA
jgi:hypothetical protein